MFYFRSLILSTRGCPPSHHPSRGRLHIYYIIIHQQINLAYLVLLEWLFIIGRPIALTGAGLFNSNGVLNYF